VPVATQAAKAYASFYLLNNSFIPLDLVVLIDLAKILYSLWLESDVSVFGLQVKNMSLHEDLAQVEFLFCDKTGTLTQNELRFRGLCLRSRPIVASPRIEDAACASPDMDLLTRAICLCHDATMVKSDKGSFITGSSQDELVLLQMTKDQALGCFLERDSDFFKIEVNGKKEIWKTLRVFEFSSERKFMSRVVQSEQGQVLLLAKGADSAILERCKTRDTQVEEAVDYFANLGFRTLTFGFRELQLEQLDALTQDELETQMELLAVTGVEDLLQVDVADVLT
jgi:magnesium-transporting ATPase (P-type)